MSLSLHHFPKSEDELRGQLCSVFLGSRYQSSPQVTAKGGGGRGRREAEFGSTETSLADRQTTGEKRRGVCSTAGVEEKEEMRQVVWKKKLHVSEVYGVTRS